MLSSSRSRAGRRPFRGGTGAPPSPCSKCEMGPAGALPWRGECSPPRAARARPGPGPRAAAGGVGVRASPTFSWRESGIEKGRWVPVGRKASLGGAGVARGEKAPDRWLPGRSPGPGAAQDPPPPARGLRQGCPVSPPLPSPPLPPPLFPFSFTDHTLPFKRNATHIQRHKCSSLVSF